MRRTKGFTIIELVIYLGITSIMMVAVFGSLYEILRTRDLEKERSFAMEEANFVLRKLDNIITNASSIEFPAPGITGATLAVVSEPDFVVVNEISNIINIKRNGGEFAPLHVSLAENLQFEHLPPSEGPDGGRPPAIAFSFKIHGMLYKKIIFLR